MSQQKQGRRKPRRRNKPTYQHHPHAVNISAWSPDGSPVPQAVLDEIAIRVSAIALEHRLLTQVLQD